jgi:low molecular weight protein-tyrosine phosphatase
MINVLFVCLGNICRSPSGDGVFKALVNKEGLEDLFQIDSAGTSTYHVGESADRRMRKHASRRNISLTSLSRQFIKKDFNNFDYILAMDSSNYKDIMAMDIDDVYSDKVYKMTESSTLYKGRDIPDPYYGGDSGFEEVLDMLEESCMGFLKMLKGKHGF